MHILAQLLQLLVLICGVLELAYEFIVLNNSQNVLDVLLCPVLRSLPKHQPQFLLSVLNQVNASFH